MATAFGCVDNTIRLRSGLYLNLADPRQDQFTIDDIACALSKICRFGGHVESFYSVAEHSVHCLGVARDDCLSPNEQFACLMHDAAEAFVGDVVKPLKVMLQNYDAIECRMEGVIADKFGIDFVTTKAAYKKIDHEMLIAERRALFSADNVKWFGEDRVRHISPPIQCWNPKVAEQEFLSSVRQIVAMLRRGA